MFIDMSNIKSWLEKNGYREHSSNLPLNYGYLYLSNKEENGILKAIFVVDNQNSEIKEVSTLRSIIKDIKDTNRSLENRKSEIMTVIIDTCINKKLLRVSNTVCIGLYSGRIMKGRFSRLFSNELSFMQEYSARSIAVDKFQNYEGVYPAIEHNVITTYILIALNIAIFFFIGGNELAATDGISSSLWVNGQRYRILTYMFVHTGYFHLFGNMIALYFIGSSVERRMGWHVTAIIYMISGIFGAMLSMTYSSNNLITIGASGAICGLMGANIIIATMMPKYLRGSTIFTTTLWFVLIIISGYMNSSVDNWCHIGGFIGGMLCASVVSLLYSIFGYNKISEYQRTHEQITKEYISSLRRKI